MSIYIVFEKKVTPKIIKSREACVFALFASCSTQYSAALRCAAGQITIDPKARHHTCCFFVDDACRSFAVAVAVVSLGRWNQQ